MFSCSFGSQDDCSSPVNGKSSNWKLYAKPASSNSILLIPTKVNAVKKLLPILFVNDGVGWHETTNLVWIQFQAIPKCEECEAKQRDAGDRNTLLMAVGVEVPRTRR